MIILDYLKAILKSFTAFFFHFYTAMHISIGVSSSSEYDLVDGYYQPIIEQQTAIILWHYPVIITR